jgi:hypothetical protein
MNDNKQKIITFAGVTSVVAGVSYFVMRKKIIPPPPRVTQYNHVANT